MSKKEFNDLDSLIKEMNSMLFESYKNGVIDGIYKENKPKLFKFLVRSYIYATIPFVVLVLCGFIQAKPFSLLLIHFISTLVTAFLSSAIWFTIDLIAKPKALGTLQIKE